MLRIILKSLKFEISVFFLLKLTIACLIVISVVSMVIDGLYLELNVMMIFKNQISHPYCLMFFSNIITDITYNLELNYHKLLQ